MITTRTFSIFLTLYQIIFLAWPILKAFTDNKIDVTEKLKFVSGRTENIVGKGENTGYQHFLFLPTMFSRGSFF